MPNSNRTQWRENTIDVLLSVAMTVVVVAAITATVLAGAATVPGAEWSGAGFRCPPLETD